MYSKIISTATNSFHYFPDYYPSNPQEFSSEELGIWPFDGQRFITKIDDCFDKKLLQEVNADIKGMECVPNVIVGNRNIMRVPILGDLSLTLSGVAIHAPVVSFDENCQIKNKRELKGYFKERKTPESVSELFEGAVENIANNGGWSKENMPVHSFFLRYQLNDETPSVKNLEWHRDLNSLSMTSVISPCKQEEGEFSGGNLLFAERTKDYTRYSDRSKSENTVLENTVLESTVKEFSYPENGCFIFENLWSQHKVSDIEKISGDSCERVLFSIFLNPEPAQLDSLVSNKKADNLA